MVASNMQRVFRRVVYHGYSNFDFVQKLWLTCTEKVLMVPACLDVCCSHRKGADGACMLGVCCSHGKGADGACMLGVCCSHRKGADGACMLGVCCSHRKGADGACMLGCVVHTEKVLMVPACWVVLFTQKRC